MACTPRGLAGDAGNGGRKYLRLVPMSVLPGGEPITRADRSAGAAYASRRENDAAAGS